MSLRKLKNDDLAGRSNIFIARQPIFRRNKKVYGYELLFRSNLDNFFDPAANGEVATSNVIVDSFLLIGINNVTQGRKAFINFTEDMLTKDYPKLFPRRQTVVEILENVEVTEKVVRACRLLADDGYMIALDDFLYEPRFDPLLRIASVVKFDLQQMTTDELERQVDIVSEFNVKLLAEKVETNEEFALALDLGFDYYQGYFFKKPEIITGRDIPGSKLHYLRILKQIKDANYSFVELARLISDDVSLSYKLLKYVNSAYFRRRQEIHSLQTAVAMVGEEDLRKWLSLMMLSYLADDKPTELIRLSVLRAKFCESIGQIMAPGTNSDKFHTAGMFSLLDVLLDQSMGKILRGLNLADDINSALMGRKKGRIFGALRLAQAYERGAWVAVDKLCGKLGVDQGLLPALYEIALEQVRMYEFV